ncbi:10308_t:CDS:1, partial [Acaulospora colombiana]
PLWMAGLSRVLRVSTPGEVSDDRNLLHLDDPKGSSAFTTTDLREARAYGNIGNRHHHPNWGLVGKLVASAQLTGQPASFDIGNTWIDNFRIFLEIVEMVLIANDAAVSNMPVALLPISTTYFLYCQPSGVML